MIDGKDAEIILIRHGETQWNTEGRWQGHADSPLTGNGIQQARALAQRLSILPFSALYSSDLGRALETASIIAEATGHDVIADPRLRERNMGVLQGLTAEEMKEKYPEEFAQYRVKMAEYVIPDGESANQRARINIDYLSHIAQNHMGECAVVVTHGGVLNNMFRYVLKIPPEGSRKYHIYNTAINSFVYDGKDWKLRTWGDISHYADSSVVDEIQV